MSLELIAVQGCTLAHAAGSLISGGVFVISSTPNAKAKAESKGIYTTPLQFTFSGGNAAGFVPGSVMTTAPVSMPATAAKVKAGGVLVMREGDFVLMNCTGTTLPNPPGTPGPVAGNVEISVAGQTKVKGQ
jgi:hypothetical protein